MSISVKHVKGQEKDRPRAPVFHQVIKLFPYMTSDVRQGGFRDLAGVLTEDTAYLDEECFGQCKEWVGKKETIWISKVY